MYFAIFILERTMVFKKLKKYKRAVMKPTFYKVNRKMAFIPVMKPTFYKSESKNGIHLGYEAHFLYK